MTSPEQELKSISEKLLALDREKQSLLQRQQVLLKSNLLLSQKHNTPVSDSLPPSEKVTLFSRYFRGRDDVYAIRWENRQGRNGYALACKNEWQAGLCYKPKIKCGDCKNSAFKRLDSSAIYDHLSGKQVVGLYPLLADDRCWFLAVDFDKSDWQLAVAAFIDVCNDMKIPFVVERSRSGNGAHIWVFFENSLPAQTARRLGFTLLDKAMEKHAGLSFESYDRLFPNQDMLPEGGFGNLIALPLQHDPRKSGNSVFIDKNMEPYVDQWAFLASVGKMSVKEVSEALIQFRQPLPGAALKPWEKGLPLQKMSIEGCPKEISVVLANRIYLPVSELPQALQAKLKRIASFSNPVFFKTQALRFSTSGIPRYICTAYFDQEYLSLPRGCWDDVAGLLAEQSILLSIDDKRFSGFPLKGMKFKGELREDQKKAVAALVKNDTGVLHAPTAFGKTVVAIGIIVKREVNTLILVHSRQLLDQWEERLSMFLDSVEIGVMGGGKYKPSGKIDIATYQSLIDRKDNSVKEYLFKYGQVIVDECHHISAPQYEMLLSEVHAKYVLGVTATPQRQDGHQPIIFMQAGPIRYHVKGNSGAQFEQRVVVRQIVDQPPQGLIQGDTRPHIADIYRWLMDNEMRNKLIVADVAEQVAQNRHPLVLTERREHALVLSRILAEQGFQVQVLRGAMRAKERREAKKAIPGCQVLVATGKYIGEGFDLPKLDTLFLALPISWKGSLAQYAGRIQRQIEGKERVIIYDYVDIELPTLQRMYRRRCKGYDAMGYTVNEEGGDGLVQAALGLEP